MRRLVGSRVEVAGNDAQSTPVVCMRTIHGRWHIADSYP